MKTADYCAQHAPEGMVNVKRKKWRSESCGKIPSFGVTGTKTAEYCAQHAQGGMGYCYESLERVIGINHKYWNHGKIKGDKGVITPFDIRNGVILTLEG